MNDPHLVVRRDDFELRLYRRGEEQEKFVCALTYPIAVGQAGLETPAGMYWVTSRSRHPDYQYPDSEWVAPELRGKLIPYGDPDNPIAGRWLGLWHGVGIHGTYDDASIGTPASHGCIRLHQADSEELFEYVPKGTPCFIL